MSRLGLTLVRRSPRQSQGRYPLDRAVAEERPKCGRGQYRDGDCEGCPCPALSQRRNPIHAVVLAKSIGSIVISFDQAPPRHHSASLARIIAGLSGFFTLINPVTVPIGRARSAASHDAFEAHLAGLLEDQAASSVTGRSRTQPGCCRVVRRKFDQAVCPNRPLATTVGRSVCRNDLLTSACLLGMVPHSQLDGV
jgi:hypothetical protein